MANDRRSVSPFPFPRSSLGNPEALSGGSVNLPSALRWWNKRRDKGSFQLSVTWLNMKGYHLQMDAFQLQMNHQMCGDVKKLLSVNL